MLNLHEKKTKFYKTPVALTACAFEGDYVITNCTQCVGQTILID